MPSRSRLTRSAIRRSDSGGGGGGGSGTVTFVTGTCRIQINGTPTVAPVVDGGQIVACWSGTRFYAVDPDGGNDANAGFGATMAAAGAVAKKTVAAALAIIPPIGNGQSIVLAVKLSAGGAQIAEDVNLIGLSGYLTADMVGTTDFSDTNTDKVVSGAVIGEPGPGSGSSWVVASGATTTSIPVSSSSFTAPIGLRGRITSGALSGKTFMVKSFSNTGTPALVPDVPLTGAPAAGVTFVLETPGVYFQTMTVQVDGSGGGNIFPTWRFRGIAADNWFVSSPAASIAFLFCDQRGATNFCDLEIFTALFQRVWSGSLDLGASLRAEGIFSARKSELTTYGGVALTLAGTSPVLSDCRLGIHFLQGAYLAGGMTFYDCSHSLGTAIGGRGVTGSDLFCDKSLTFGDGCILDVDGVTYNALGAVAIAITGSGQVLHLKRLSGTYTFGLDVSATHDAKVAVDEATVASAGVVDIAFSGATGGFADLRVTNVVDASNNCVHGVAGGLVVSACELYTNSSGGNLEVGFVVRSNGTSGQVDKAFADVAADAEGVLGVVVNFAANTGGVYVADAGFLRLRFAAAPTIKALARVSAATAGLAVDATPASGKQELRLGWIGKAAVINSLNYGVVSWQPELQPTTVP